MKSAVIIGATSGIGRELSFELSRRGYKLGITGRRTPLLEEIRDSLNTECHISEMDVTKTNEGREMLLKLIREMGGADIIILNAGISGNRHDVVWEDSKKVIDTNVSGFTALADTAWNYFLSENKPGHIVGISSVAALVPNGGNSIYNASKAFVSRYMEGLQVKARKRNLPILLTDIKPGFIYTPMTESRKGMFWVSTVEKAVQQIADAIEKRRYRAFITKRWRMIGWLSRILPTSLFRKFAP